jgi:cyclopropane fatty-acyl-phospholipid synthase-like methyltransferase
MKKSSKQADFGTYHHTTALISQTIREEAKQLFEETFGDLPFSRDTKLKILDIGCGLGFLSCLCAEYYSNAMIIGFDAFEDASLEDSSLEKAQTNARILGFSRRVTFEKQDIFRADYSKQKFDLFVSNLVFHNLEKRRMSAYDRLAAWMTPGSFVVMGDLFFDYSSDFKRLSRLFSGIREIPSHKTMEAPFRVLVLSEPKL